MCPVERELGVVGQNQGQRQSAVADALWPLIGPLQDIAIR